MCNFLLFFFLFLCFDFVPFVGDPRECRGDVAFPPTCEPPLKAGVRQPILILSPLYHLPCPPPPRCKFFCQYTYRKNA